MITSNLPSEDASKTNTQVSNTVQTPDVPNFPLFNIQESIKTRHSVLFDSDCKDGNDHINSSLFSADVAPPEDVLSTQNHTSVPTSLVIPHNHVFHTLSSNINSLFSYIDRHCHSLYPEWSTPIMFPQ